jgi:hypothetical protein
LKKKKKKREKTIRIGKALECIDLGNYFLNGTPIAQQLRERIDKWDCVKLKS